MTHIAWASAYDSGLKSMDDAHRELVRLIDDLLDGPEAALAPAFERLAAHARAHFEEEDRSMRGTAYASAGCHLDEHKAVLASIAEVGELLAAGDRSHVRSIARALADWFPEHVEAMDLGLARWQQQSLLGGSPVTIHRSTPKNPSAPSPHSDPTTRRATP